MVLLTSSYQTSDLRRHPFAKRFAAQRTPSIGLHHTNAIPMRSVRAHPKCPIENHVRPGDRVTPRLVLPCDMTQRQFSHHRAHPSAWFPPADERCPLLASTSDATARQQASHSHHRCRHNRRRTHRMIANQNDSVRHLPESLAAFRARSSPRLYHQSIGD